MANHRTDIQFVAKTLLDSSLSLNLATSVRNRLTEIDQGGESKEHRKALAEQNGELEPYLIWESSG